MNRILRARAIWTVKQTRLIATRNYTTGNWKVLGIETSCDDSGVAIVDSTGSVLSEGLSSQWELHTQYGGVMPTMAARAHEANLPVLIDQVLQSGESFDAVAVTVGPGLTPCLRVGLSEARKLCSKYSVPLIPVNHLEGHLLSTRLPEIKSQGSSTQIGFPHLTLLVSGGHCMIVLVLGVGKYITLGTALDDSIGEAFDKVARMLGCDASSGKHPGAVLEILAAAGDKDASKFNLNLPLQRSVSCDFSFSGLKTQVVRHVENLNRSDLNKECTILQRQPEHAAALASAFQQTAVEHLVVRTRRALAWTSEALQLDSSFGVENTGSNFHRHQRKWKKEQSRVPRDWALKLRTKVASINEPLPSQLKGLVLCGGVARNKTVRQGISNLANLSGVPLFVPPLQYCTDNAVMIAWAAQERLRTNCAFLSPMDGAADIQVRGRWPVDSLVACDEH